MNKIISTFGLAALLGGFALSPAHAERDAQEREAYRDTQRQPGARCVSADCRPAR